MSALDYLDSLQGSGIRPGLSRIRTVLRRMGNPQKAVPSVIVAGTNGKGSTAAMLASILEASGYRTGFYSSPHLVDIRERWLIGGAPIENGLLEQAVAALRRAAAEASIEPTYFEALTIVAFIAFRMAGSDAAVLEVGMGGRLDATNVVKPVASLITPIGFDHLEYLGTTLRQIAREKAGVIHRGGIALTSNDDPAVLDVLRRRAAKFGGRLIVVTEEHDTPLAGAFQRLNAGLAVRAARELKGVFARITDETIERGAAATRWRGRLERLQWRGKQVWIDGAHNAHAASVVARFISEHVPAPRTLVFGVMSDKDLREIAGLLFPLFRRIIATEPFPPRSASAETLAGLARTFGADAEPVARPAEAFARAVEGPDPSVVIAGSLYLAGAAIRYFE